MLRREARDDELIGPERLLPPAVPPTSVSMAEESAAMRAHMWSATYEYVCALRSLLGGEVRDSVVRYLCIACNFVPIKSVVVGQSPYADDLLPQLASSFAYGPTNGDKCTPSACVLAQAMHTCHDVFSVSAYHTAVANSFLHITRGVLFVNACPANGLDACEVAVAESLTCEWLCNVTMRCTTRGGDNLRIYSFGDRAHALCPSTCSLILSYLPRPLPGSASDRLSLCLWSESSRRTCSPPFSPACPLSPSCALLSSRAYRWQQVARPPPHTEGSRGRFRSSGRGR